MTGHFRSPRLLAAVVTLALAGAAVPRAARGQSNEDCLACHEDPGFTATIRGSRVSLHVDRAAYAKSVHGELDCVGCHETLAGADFPHPPEPERASCSTCHDRQSAEQGRSVHGRAAARGDPLAPDCATCHGEHAILPRSDPASPTAVHNIPFLCGKCHHEGSPVSLTHDIPQDRILENYSESIHGEGLLRMGLTVTAVCTSCHRAHEILPHGDPRSSIHRDNVSRTCEQCHVRIEEVHRKVIEGRLWQDDPARIPVCVDCHSPHRIRNVFYPQGMADKDCLSCHGKPGLEMTRGGKAVSLYVDQSACLQSAHRGVACSQCHSEASPSHVRACETIRSKVDCSVCHAAVVQEYRTSAHGVLASRGDPDAPGCLDCHGKHDVLPHDDPAALTYPRNVPGVCARCHAQGQAAGRRVRPEVGDVVALYEESIHGKGLLESGLVVTATCPDCHTAHHELPAQHPESSVNPKNIPRTCGRCHHGIEQTFMGSIHATGKAHEGVNLPSCEDCHSSHSISRTDRADFRVSVMDQCGNCHLEEAETFFDTYHGKVSRLGSERAAKCYDCHGTHDILPPSDPASSLSHANVVATCAQCHAGAHRRFAGYLTHATHHDRHKYPWLFWAFWGMTGLLVGTLAFAVTHTGAWLWRLSRTPGLRVRHAAPGARRVYQRFRKFHRGLHLTMIVSFFTLALTGMSLKFSYMGWAQGLSVMLGGFDSMGFLHRAAAVLLIGIFLTHLADLRRQKREAGLSWARYITHSDSIMFNLNDLKEMWGSFRWFFGRGERPRYGRYTYWEKFDYFAVFWGVAIIGSTGLMLWFPEFFTRLLPGWAVNVATIVHSDEALLAVGFIFTIHFFNTHFRPDKFPMDTVIFTGQVDLEELRRDKPREYEALVSRPGYEEELVEPMPESMVRRFRVFGFTAVAIGLTLVGFIIYSMIFAYR